jgi:hypothetical protein
MADAIAPTMQSDVQRIFMMARNNNDNDCNERIKEKKKKNERCEGE